VTTLVRTDPVVSDTWKVTRREFFSFFAIE